MTPVPAFDLRYYLLLRWSADNSSGVNCWGLVREFYRREFAKFLPEFQVSASNVREIMRNSEHSPELKNWHLVAGEKWFGDVAQLTLATRPQHYAIYLGEADSRWLHASQGFSPVAVDEDTLRLQGYRTLKLWRHY